MIVKTRFFRGIAIMSVLLAPTLQVFGGEASFTKQTDFKVRMSDGVHLTANVYLPEAGKKFATVLMRTPYNSKGMGWIAEPLAEAGYAVVVQNVRGQFGSEGMFIPFIYEKKDGLDTLDWVASSLGATGTSVCGGHRTPVTARWLSQRKVIPTSRLSSTWRDGATRL